MRGHAELHGYDTHHNFEIYHHVKFMMRHPNWVLETTDGQSLPNTGAGHIFPPQSTSGDE